MPNAKSDQAKAVNRLEEVNAYLAAEQPALELGENIVEASTPFVGQWRTLVSTTNWEKGRIICGWRASLESGGAEITEYSDEAWAQLVGGVTGQHVGRLRRVFQRFGEVFTEYDGLYWSHFQAACEWDDAEMWLEGALQNGWSVSQMRGQRWEVNGTGPAPESSPAEEAALASGLPGLPASTEPAPAEPTNTSSSAEVREAREEGDPPASDEEDASPTAAERSEPAASESEHSEAVRPFAELPELPDDLADAFEQFKLAILNHKLAGWSEVSRSDVLGVLASLKMLAEAPSEE